MGGGGGVPDWSFIILEYTNPVANHLTLKLKYPLHQYKLVEKEKTSEILKKYETPKYFPVDLENLKLQYRYCFLSLISAG